MLLESTDDFGSALRTARERSGRSLREVADATKLAVRTLEALERNQVDRLPGGIFRRAVVRAYAKEIGLDPEATLKVFLARHPDTLPAPGATRVVVDPPAPTGRRTLVVVATGIVVALVVLLVVAGYLLWPRVGVGLVRASVPGALGTVSRAASAAGVPLRP